MDGVDGVDCDSRCWGAFAFCLRVSQAITILLYSTAAMSSLLQAVFLSLPQSADRCPHSIRKHSVTSRRADGPDEPTQCQPSTAARL